MNTLTLYAHSSLHAYVCFPGERVYTLYWILRGSVNQIHELLIVECSVIFWLQKSAKVLDAPSERYHRNALFVLSFLSFFLSFTTIDLTGT